MTDQDIRNIKAEIHELTFRLQGTPNNSDLLKLAKALANEATHLVSEVIRLRALARQAVSDLKKYDPTTAEKLNAQVDWNPTGPA
jgi:hypothetical protein